MEGGRASLHVLDASIDNFVREVLQNSLDQSSGAGPVTVRFRLEDLEGDAREAFLEASGGEGLIPHLRGAAEGDGPFSRCLSETLAALPTSPLRVLTIEDSGSKGLTGGEFETRGNFKSLCRDWLMTAESNERRGGSYGIGKALLWRFSSLSTVFFCSRVEREPRDGVRFIGRTELPYHRTDDCQWDGPGWFGIEVEDDAGSRAESVWDEVAEDTSKTLGAFRPIQLGTGTTVVIPGFSDPLADDELSIDELATALGRSATAWYWPALSDGRLRVEVSTSTGVISNCSASTIAGPQVGLLDLDSNVLGSRLMEPGDVAVAKIPFKIPARKARLGADGAIIEPRLAQEQAQLELRVVLLPEEGDPVDGEGQITYLRGSGMILDSRRPKAVGTGQGRFAAILLAGTARGQGTADLALDRFLRACEPPAHNCWVPTERVQALYERGTGARLLKMWADVDRALGRTLEGATRKRRKGPQQLAKLFHMGTKPGPVNHGVKFKVDELNAHLEGNEWQFSGRVRAASSQERPWQFNVRLFLDADGGGSTLLGIGHLESTAGKTERDGGRVFAPAGIHEILFSGASIKADSQRQSPDLLRTRIRIDVQAKLGGLA